MLRDKTQIPTPMPNYKHYYDEIDQLLVDELYTL